MILKNGKVFYKGEFRKLTVKTCGEKIEKVAEEINENDEVIDCTDMLVIPGIIDIHTHACKGYDFSTAGKDEMKKMCEYYADNGETSVVATGMTLPIESLVESYTKIGELIKEKPNGAKVVGINMEGPYISTEYRGCHNTQYIVLPTLEHYRKLQEVSGNNIKIVDLSPCSEGAIDFIKEVKDETTVSLAHSPATYEEAVEAIEAGASNMTHLFNAMSPMTHRKPGMVGAAFDTDVTTELICDGVHIHPAVIRTVFKIMPDRVCLVSDSMSAAGMEDGQYELGGMEVFVKDGKATLANGTIAGSTITAYKGMCNVVKFGVPIEQAVKAATETPARAIRMEDKIGKIEEGLLADIVLLDKDTLEVRKVIIDGKLYK